MSKKTIGRRGGKTEGRKRSQQSFLLNAMHFAIIRDRTPGLMKQEAAKHGISVRTAYYLANLFDRYRYLRIPSSRLSEIGWTKLQIIGPYINKSNCEQLLSLAEENTTRELALLMQNEVSQPGTRCVILYFAPDDYVLFEAALISHGALKTGRGLSNKEPAPVSILSAKKS